MGFFVNNESHHYFSFNTDWTEKEVEFLYSCSEDTSASKLNTWSVKLKSSSGFKRLCPPVVNCASPVDYAASGYVWTVSVAVTHSWGEIQLPTFSTSRGPAQPSWGMTDIRGKKMGWGVCVCVRILKILWSIFLWKHHLGFRSLSLMEVWTWVSRTNYWICMFCSGQSPAATLSSLTVSLSMWGCVLLVSSSNCRDKRIKPSKSETDEQNKTGNAQTAKHWRSSYISAPWWSG